MKAYYVRFAADKLRPIRVDATSAAEAARQFARLNGLTSRDAEGAPGGWVIEVWSEDRPYPSASPDEFTVAEVLQG